MTAESLVLPPDLSREEPAASNIHLLKPTKHDSGAILHRGFVTKTDTAVRRSHGHIFSGSIVSPVHTLTHCPAHFSLSFLMESL